MTAQIGIPVDASTEQLRIIIGTLYLSLARAMSTYQGQRAHHRLTDSRTTF